MKKHFILMSCLILFVMIIFTACNNSSTENIESKATKNPEESIQMDSQLPDENHESQKIEENETLDWSEITENGVDEELFLKSLDINVLKTVATELQT